MDAARSTPAGRSSAAGLRDKTTLMRLGSGRNLEGIDSHVLRPMTTALSRPPAPAGSGSVVMRLK